MNAPNRPKHAFLTGLPEHTVRMLQNLQDIFLNPEADLHDSDILLRSILDSATEYAIVAADPEKNIITWNTGAERIFGYSNEEIIGCKKLGFLIPDEESKPGTAREAIREQISNKGLWMGEALRKRKNGETFYARIVVTPLRSRNRQPIGSIAIIRDITREKNLYNQIEENARNLEAKVAERTLELEKSGKMMMQELQFAQLIQRSMLKNSIREIPRYKYFYKYYPSKVIGGDFFTVRQLDDHRYYFYISDVSGHGVPAAMLTVYVHQTIRNLVTVASDKPGTPAAVLNRLNKAFCKEHFPGSPFLTIFFCFLDLSTDTLTYSLAGHHPCILYNNETGKLSTFGHSGKPIGVFEEQEYKDASISLGVQDNVFLFTDGLTEVFNKEGVKVFDAKSLVKFLSERAKMSESGTIKALVQHLKDLRGQSSFEDDIAILNIKREK